MLIQVPGKDKRELKLRFGPGSRVVLRVVPEIHAIVVGVVVRSSDVLFECNWINDNGLQTGFFADFELDPLPPVPKAGFRPSHTRRRKPR